MYPWTRQYFDSFGDLSSAAAVLANAKLAAHGKVVCAALDQAVKHMDDIKGIYARLSQLHSEKLHVDPGNFRVGLPSSAIKGMISAKGLLILINVYTQLYTKIISKV